VEKKFDLDERLIEYAAMVSETVGDLPHNMAGNYLADQLIRSGLAPALNHAEAQSAESRADFIHKMKISLKELRESFIFLRIIERLKLLQDDAKLGSILDETNQLISIFVKSIETTKRNKNKPRPHFKILCSLFVLLHSVFLVQCSMFNLPR